MLVVVSALAANPERDGSVRRHPNIDATQRLVAQAFERIVVAQKAKEYDIDGHAQKAKELLYLVNEELKMAAEATNKRAQ